MTVEISITGNPAECRNAIYQMRLMRDIFIADIYEERQGNSVQEWYCVIMDGKGNPCWSLDNLPDPDSFVEAVKKRSWPGKAKRRQPAGTANSETAGRIACSITIRRTVP